MNIFKKYQLKNYNFILVVSVLILSVIGILSVGSALPSAQTKQIIGVSLGIIGLRNGSHADAVNDYSWIDGRDRRRLRAGRNRHVNTYEVVLHGHGADGILLADVGVAARHLDVFRLAVVERHFHAEFESRPKREVGKKLKNK